MEDKAAVQNREVEKKEAPSSKASSASASKKEIALTPKQEDFCRIFAGQPLPRNATRAYMEAYGCSEKSAGANVARLMGDDRIRARITALNSEFTARHFITRDNVLAGFWRIYEQCVAAAPVLDAKGRQVTTKIKRKGPDGEEEVEELCGVWKFDSKGANTALQSIARYLGLFNADTSGATNVAVSVEVANVRDLITAEMSRLHSMGADGASDDNVQSLQKVSTN